MYLDFETRYIAIADPTMFDSCAYTLAAKRQASNSLADHPLAECDYLSSMAGYSGTPLATKLGIKPDSLVLLDGAPTGFDLGALPSGARVDRRPGTEPYPVIVCFCPDHDRLRSRWPVLHRLTTSGGALWIAWPKRASRVPTDLDDTVVREHVLAHGRVDVKVAAIDDVWAGLKNVVRTADR